MIHQRHDGRKSSPPSASTPQAASAPARPRLRPASAESGPAQRGGMVIELPTTWRSIGLPFPRNVMKCSYRPHLLLLPLAVVCGAALVPLPAQEPARVPSADEIIQQQAREAPLALKFQGRTAEECRAWQKQFEARLRSLLGPHRPPQKWKVIEERTVELPDHT